MARTLHFRRNSCTSGILSCTDDISHSRRGTTLCDHVGVGACSFCVWIAVGVVTAACDSLLASVCFSPFAEELSFPDSRHGLHLAIYTLALPSKHRCGPSVVEQISCSGDLSRQPAANDGRSRSNRSESITPICPIPSDPSSRHAVACP
jgi:hypothetical protein